MERNQFADQPRRRRHRDLLPENGAHGEFESVPRAWNPEARTSSDQWRQHRVLAEMSADRHGIGGKIEDAANARDDRRQMPESRKANGRPEAVSLRRFDDQYTVLVADRDRAHIPAARHRLDARDGSRAKERQDGVPVVGRPVAELDRNRARFENRLIGQSLSPECCGRPPVQLLEYLVESPDAAEAGRRGDLCHRQSRVLDQLLGQKDPPGLGDR